MYTIVGILVVHTLMSNVYNVFRLVYLIDSQNFKFYFIIKFYILLGINFVVLWYNTTNILFYNNLILHLHTLLNHSS